MRSDINRSHSVPQIPPNRLILLLIEVFALEDDNIGSEDFNFLNKEILIKPPIQVYSIASSFSIFSSNRNELVVICQSNVGQRVLRR